MEWYSIRGLIGSVVVGVVLLVGAAPSSQAADNEITLSATATFTTDYIFRGVSYSGQEPAVQPQFDLSYGIFYLGMWGSNLDLGGTPFGGDVASVEIDYYGGIAPTWQGITFDIGGLYYTFPGAFDPAGNFDYFELSTGASYTFGDALTLGVQNYWSPDYSGEIGDSDALEFSAEYAFSGKLLNFFSPSISGGVGWQWFSDIDSDFTYWNAGLTLGFMENWSADVRYWDTDFSTDGCAAFTGFRGTCDARVVGTLSASF